LRAIENGERESPRDRWDPDYVVQMVGRDPQRLFEWVRDETSWIPYRGVLRGPVGVLMDRQGNSLDRALLLATLLQKAGHTVRLAHGELPVSRAIEIMPTLVSRQATFAAPAADVVAEPEARVYVSPATYAISGNIERALQSRADALARTAAEVRARVADQTARLRAALPSNRGAAEWHARFDVAFGALRDHWWVQRRDGDLWLDADLLDPASTTGDASVAPTVTLAPASLPDNLYQQIVVRVIAEQWSDRRLEEHKVLERALRPADLTGQSVVLQFWPLDWVGSGPSHTGDDLRRAAATEHAWSATLFVGRDAVATEGLLDTGEDLNAPIKGGPLADIANQFASDVGTRLAATALSAVWLEYEIRVPEQPVWTTRRTIFDLIGPAARATSSALTLDDAKRLDRGLALTMRTELLPVSCRFAPEFLAHVAAQSMLGARGVMEASVRGAFPTEDSALNLLFDGMTTSISPLHLIALTRFEWNSGAQHNYITRPGLLTRHWNPVLKDGAIVLRDATDIVANDIDVALTVPDGIGARLTQGVLDTNLESLLRSGVVVGNVGDAFAASLDWTTFSSHREATLDLAFSADSRARLAEDVSSGYVVVAPAGGSRSGTASGWWRIDPASGTTLGIGDLGWGVGPEYSANLTRARVQSIPYRTYLKRFAIGFASTYVFCVSLGVVETADPRSSPIGKDVQSEEQSEQLRNERLSATIANGPQNCGPQSAVVALMATLPLVILSVRFARLARLARVAEDLPSEADVPADPVTPKSNGSGSSTGAGSSGEPNGPQPKPVQGGPGSDPAGEPRKSPAPGDDPCSSDTIVDPAKPAELGKTQPPPEAGTGAPLTKADLQPKVFQASLDAAKAEGAYFRASQEFVRYQVNAPWHVPQLGDPSKFDETVFDAMADDLAQKDLASRRAATRWRKLREAFDKAPDGAPAAPACGPSPAASPAGASGADPSLDKTVPRSLPGGPAGDPALDKTLLDPAMDKTVDDPTKTQPGMKTLTGFGGLSGALEGGR
jgi:hypothetical protein